MKTKQPTPITRDKPGPTLAVTPEQYQSIREVSYALCELDAALNCASFEGPTGSLVKIISDKLFASLGEIEDDDANMEAIRVANDKK
ncbi:MAG: hypothetical protein LAP85_20295 [Acidobacteriia bacterium]|nr:hypothetical protein [Terriglobia bacterium]